MRTSIDLLLISVYIGVIVLANGLVTAYGQVALPYTAFLLIPFDLVIRDLLQDRWQVKSRLQLAIRMGLLICGGSGIAYWTTVASAQIATASMVAFVLTGALDAVTYQWMIKYGRIFRINMATIVAAITDSLVFAWIAFDAVDGELVAWQSLSKIAGGFVWSLVLYRFFKRPTKPKERQVLLWIGDGMAPAGPELIGRPVEFEGRKGIVVATTLLTVTVEWE